MVALVIAAVGSFVSCKDYDDDINNLQKQIDAKAAISELTALQSTLDSKIAAAQTAATAAQAKADAAATKTSVDELKKALETAIADAKKAGTDAGTQAGEAIAAANKAQETAEGAAQAAKDADAAAKAALADALKTIEETYQTKAAAAEAAEALAAVKATADAAFTKAEAEELKAEVEGLKDELEAAIDEKIDAKIQEVNNAVASVDAIWSAVTQVDLHVDPSGLITNLFDFRYGKVAVTEEFGDESYDESIETIKYKEGEDIQFNSEFLIRVNPVNAEITADQIVFVNSLGEQTLADFIEIGTPTRYAELMTRAENVNTGLWRVPVTLKKGADQKELAKVMKVGGKEVYFSLALNNVDGQDDRFAATACQIWGVCGPYEPATAFDVFVNGTSINNIKNRWDGDIIKAEDGTTTSKNPEYIWRTNNDKIVTPTAEADILTKADDNKNYNVVTGDARYDKALKAVEEGDKVVLSFAGLNEKKIEYYYVVFDKDNAIESAPSEYNAWKKYQATNLGTIVKAGQKLEIELPEGKGDIIGFRVYAVNYDGTLADPDGKAFYIQYGEPAAVMSATAAGTFKANTVAPTIAAGKNIATAKDNATGKFAVEGADFESLAIKNGNIKVYGDFTSAATLAALDINSAFANPNGTIVLVSKAAGTDNAAGWAKNVYDGKLAQTVAAATEVTVHYVLLKANGDAAENWDEVTDVAVQVENVESWVDNATISFDIVGIDASANNREMNKLTVSLTKALTDTTPTGWNWKATQGPDNNNLLTLYMNPENSVAIPAAESAAPVWGDLATWGTKDLGKIFNYPAADAAKYQFVFTAASSQRPSATKPYNDVKVKFNAGTNTEEAQFGGVFSLKGASATSATTVWNCRVGDGNTYATAVQYNYGAIKLKYNSGKEIGDATTPRYVVSDHNYDVWTGNTKFSYVLSPDVYHVAWKPYTYQVKSGTNDVAKTSTEYYIQYNAATAVLNPVYVSEAGTANADNITFDGTTWFKPSTNKLTAPATAGSDDFAAGVIITPLLDITSDITSAPIAYTAGNYNIATPGYTLTSGARYYQFFKTPTNYYIGADFLQGTTEDYYNASYASGTNTLTFAPIAASAPTSQVPSTIKIQATDVFGHKIVVAELPIVLKN